mmetsp:Transcript_16941/g.18978  ORF Transcript_16941/g.18978 Transcript_16941/m.18978 type:complete len:386 (+) Transcript_16941:78-1235(+)
MVKKKLKKTTLEERKQRFSSQSTLILLLGISVGYLLSVAWRDQQHLFQTLDRVGSMTVYSSSSSSSSSSNDGDDNAAADLRKLQRFWKYAHTYYYIPAAARYDYVPVPAQECGTGPDFAPWWKLNQYDRSRLDEDKFIYETFFKKKKHPQPGEEADDFHFNGTYVELGAFNGRQESNTRFFDLCLGWKGLLLEGNPENYQQTIRNRPFAHKMSLAPSCSAEYEAVNHTIPFFRYPMTNVGLVGHAKTYTGKPTVEVPCGPLSPVLADIFAAEEETDNSQPQRSDGGGGGVAAVLPTVDFFSLDVEGSEDLVLSTIDFHAVRINVLMIEIQNNDCKWEGCPVRQRVRAKMAAEGYQRYEKLVHASDIYVHPDSPFQIPDSMAVPNV